MQALSAFPVDKLAVLLGPLKVYSALAIPLNHWCPVPFLTLMHSGALVGHVVPEPEEFKVGIGTGWFGLDERPHFTPPDVTFIETVPCPELDVIAPALLRDMQAFAKPVVHVVLCVSNIHKSEAPKQRGQDHKYWFHCCFSILASRAWHFPKAPIASTASRGCQN
jgi:hypothetical protein